MSSESINNSVVINNEYDFSNCLPTVEYVSYLVKYMDSVYDNFIKLAKEDEEKNKQFKIDYKEWNYKIDYYKDFEIYIREKTYNNITCNDYNSFQSTVNSHNLDNVLSIKINMKLDYKRGKGLDLDSYENSFYILFEPFNITFSRKSNNNDTNMNLIETNIKEILSKFPSMNTVFCTK